MSNQNFGTGQVLFSNQTIKVKTVPIPIPFGTVQVRDDFLTRLGLHMVELRLTNNDPTNPVTFRVEPFGQLQTIPPSTLGILSDEIHTFLEINPNAVTGSGLAIAYCTPIKELTRLGLIAS